MEPPENITMIFAGTEESTGVSSKKQKKLVQAARSGRALAKIGQGAKNAPLGGGALVIRLDAAGYAG
ncbi:MAG: hypothetical protein CMD77_08575 [Gammaproteobacteria bacterium]|nr:hypothetical protein [Gammaproteobacteria bacterium]